MNPTELERYRRRLAEIRQRVTGQVGLVEGTIPEHLQKPGDITSVPTHPADNDAEGIDEDVAVAQAQVQIIEQIDEAVARIEQGVFGRCQRCSREISRERLEAVPYAPLCIECARQAEAEQPPQPPLETRQLPGEGSP
jgi:DnaK suppressor protein